MKLAGPKGYFKNLKTSGFVPNSCNFLRCKLKSDSLTLLHLKSFFRSQDIKIIALTFWSCRKNALIRNIRLISKFMTSKPGQRTISVHILHNISQNKGNQTMELGQLIEYNKRNIFLQKSHRKWRLVPNLFSFFEKALFELKASGLQRGFNIFR